MATRTPKVLFLGSCSLNLSTILTLLGDADFDGHHSAGTKANPMLFFTYARVRRHLSVPNLCADVFVIGCYFPAHLFYFRASGALGMKAFV